MPECLNFEQNPNCPVERSSQSLIEIAIFRDCARVTGKPEIIEYLGKSPYRKLGLIWPVSYRRTGYCW